MLAEASDIAESAEPHERHALRAGTHHIGAAVRSRGRRLMTVSLVLVASALTGCGNAGASWSGSIAASTSRAAAPALPATAAAPAPQSSPATSSSQGGGRATRRKTAASRPGGGAPVNRYPAALTGSWQVMSTIGGRPAMWIAARSGVTLVRMDQRWVHLALHAGSVDPGGSGWRYGDRVAGKEIHHLILGFNGGFKFKTGAGGFESFGRTAVPLSYGLGSIVTYTDGTTQIGAWGLSVPARGRAIASVRQNLHLLINHGQPDGSVATCGSQCWGATIGGAAAVARSGLGILGNGQLMWAAGENLTVAQFAHAMVSSGVQRAVELDINPDWVAGYVYIHHRSTGPTPVPVVPGQYGISGHLLLPYGRDFFTVLSN